MSDEYKDGQSFTRSSHGTFIDGGSSVGSYSDQMSAGVNHSDSLSTAAIKVANAQNSRRPAPTIYAENNWNGLFTYLVIVAVCVMMWNGGADLVRTVCLYLGMKNYDDIMLTQLGVTVGLSVSAWWLLKLAKEKRKKKL